MKKHLFRMIIVFRMITLKPDGHRYHTLRACDISLCYFVKLYFSSAFQLDTYCWYQCWLYIIVRGMHTKWIYHYFSVMVYCCQNYFIPSNSCLIFTFTLKTLIARQKMLQLVKYRAEIYRDNKFCKIIEFRMITLITNWHRYRTLVATNIDIPYLVSIILCLYVS